MKVAVTGGAGFIGAHSVRALLRRGHAVTAIDDLSHGKREAVPKGADLVVMDVRAPELMALFDERRLDAVLHLAAQMDVRRSVADPLYDASINVLGTLNVLESSRRAQVRRLVFASSGGAVYGEQDEFPAREDHPRRPASPYGVSKLCGEEYIAHYALVHGLSAMAMRYANVYGPGQDPHGEAGVVAIFVERLLAGKTAVINGDGLQTRDYVYVGDVAEANRLALESTATGALNVGTGTETTVVDLARKLADAAGAKADFAHGPAKPGEQRRSCIDPAAAARVLGWVPRMALGAGIVETVKSFRER